MAGKEEVKRKNSKFKRNSTTEKQKEGSTIDKRRLDKL